jgi:hypothetical protein
VKSLVLISNVSAGNTTCVADSMLPAGYRLIRAALERVAFTVSLRLDAGSSAAQGTKWCF